MSKSKQSSAKKKIKNSSRPPQQPQHRSVKSMSSEDLGLLLGQECTRIIQAQAIIQEAQTNVNNLKIELESRRQENLNSQEKDGDNDGKERQIS